MDFKLISDKNVIITDYSKESGNLFALSDASIYKINSIPSNFNGQGLNNVYSKLLDGNGDLNFSNTNIYYDLYNSIISTYFDSNSISIIKNNQKFNSISKNSYITAVYISDILKADEDMGFWKTISWTQSNIEKIEVSIKVCDNQNEIESLDWQYHIWEIADDTYNYQDINIIKSLDKFNLKGRFLQFKVEFISYNDFDNPYVGDLIIIYANKHSVFFFTRKIKISKEDNVDNVIVTSSYSEPINTSVKFGITNTNSSDWEEYKIISLNELVKLDNNGNSIKIGIKMSSSDPINYPIVQDIGVLIGSTADNRLNQ